MDLRRTEPPEQPHPEPEDRCPHCNKWYGNLHDRKRRVELSDLVWIDHLICPHCSNVIEASLVDQTDVYLEAWRNSPDTMKYSIDSYSDLKEYGR